MDARPFDPGYRHSKLQQRSVAIGPTIPNIGPEPTGFCCSLTRLEYGDRRVITMNTVGSQNVIPQFGNQWCQQGICLADPVGHGGAGQFHLVARINL